MNKKNLMKWILLWLMWLIFMYTNSAVAEESCRIVIDWSYDDIDYWDYVYLYSNNVYDGCSEQYVSCDYEWDDLWERYSSCSLCKIEIDWNIEYIEYWDDYWDYLYSQESSMDCYSYGENVWCYNEWDDLWEWYSSCEFQPNSPTVLDNWDLEVCGMEYISDSNGARWCITIQGKNVWATTTWAWYDATSTSNWHYYQRWNNYWFPSNGLVTTGDQQIDCSTYNPLNPFSSSTFILSTNWNFLDYCTTRNDNLWWWWEDGNELVYPVENESDRQWPCDPWYHVPSRWEWYALMDMWAGSSADWNIYYEYIPQFYTEFQIPFAGYRYNTDGSLFGQNRNANLWSSSPEVGYEKARVFTIAQDEAGTDNYYRTYGLPVRCFKDSDIGSSSSESGEPQVIVNIAEFNWWQNTCTWSNFIFENIQADKTSRDYELTWVFECAFWNSQSKTVTLQLSGNLVADWDRVISGSNVQMKNSEWTSSPVWLKFANTMISTYQALTATKTLFQKTGSMIWIASWVVSIQITVPAWTPDGTYNWTLVLTY